MQLLAQRDSGDLFIATLVVMVLIALLIGVISVVRKYMISSGDAEPDPLAGFSLASMRQLVREGKMTQEEFDAAKAQIVAAAQKASERKKPVDKPAPETKLEIEE